ncbi:MAG: iron ABC transporter permease [archaeon]|nr:iron ABC transporter permease [archaeon]
MNENDRPDVVSPLVKDKVGEWLSPVDTEAYHGTMGKFQKYVAKKYIFIIVCAFACLVAMGLSVGFGTYRIDFFETYMTIWYHIVGDIHDVVNDIVVVEDRLPRICVGVLAGAGLAVAGAAMQSILKNPLAEPYTTGVSSGAIFGASLSIVFGISIFGGDYALVGNAFVFSLIPTSVIIFVSRMKQSSPTMMIMAGIAVMYIFNAMTTVIRLWSDPDSLSSLYAWEVGTLAYAKWANLYLMLPVTVAGIVVIALLSRQLNVLATGDENARALGVNAEKLRLICLVVVALMSSAIVSYVGLIGFVGLVAPHIVRIVIGADNRFLIPASAAFGAAMLLFADLVGRVIIAPATIQVGVVMAFLGGPMFIWLIMRKNSKVWE